MASIEIKNQRSITPEKPETVMMRDICPQLVDPFPDCLVMSITSLKIPRIIEYCGGNFESCKIYQESQALKKERHLVV